MSNANLFSLNGGWDELANTSVDNVAMQTTYSEVDSQFRRSDIAMNDLMRSPEFIPFHDTYSLDSRPEYAVEIPLDEKVSLLGACTLAAALISGVSDPFPYHICPIYSFKISDSNYALTELNEWMLSYLRENSALIHASFSLRGGSELETATTSKLDLFASSGQRRNPTALFFLELYSVRHDHCPRRRGACKI